MPNKNKPLALKISFWNTQNKEKYAVCEYDGNEIMRFRTKSSARNWIRENQKGFPEGKLSVVPL